MVHSYQFSSPIGIYSISMLAHTQIKSNAVRALGNLSRFVAFTDHSTSSDGPGNSCSKCMYQITYSEDNQSYGSQL